MKLTRRIRPWEKCCYAGSPCLNTMACGDSCRMPVLAWDTAPKARMRRHINDVDGRLHPFHLLVRGAYLLEGVSCKQRTTGFSAPQCEGIVECYFGIDREERRLPDGPISSYSFVVEKRSLGETHLLENRPPPPSNHPWTPNLGG